MQMESSPHLLYLEGDRDSAQLVQRILKDAGYQIDLIDDSDVGLAMLQATAYEIVILDYRITTGNDGLTVLRSLDKQQDLPPVIMVIDPGDEAIAVDALKSGVGDYLIRDPDQRYLSLFPAVVEQVINRRRLTDERERALAALEQRNRDMTLLTWVGHELTAMRDSQQVIERLLQAVSETIGAEGCSVWLWQAEAGGALVCQAVYHNGLGQKLVNTTVEAGQGVVGWVGMHKRSTVVHTVAEDDRFSDQVDTKIGFRTTDILAVPLLAREEVIGVLEVVNKLTGRFTKDDLALVETLAASAAIAIDNARLIEALRRQAAELKERNEDLDAFAHTVAHDLKSPLAIISGTAQVLETDFDQLPEEKLRYHLGVMARRGRKASSLIEELLLLAELRHAEIHIEPLHMGPILFEAQKRLADMIGSHQPIISAPKKWPVALGYGPWIEEVWVNYLSNGLKYGGQPPRLELGGVQQSDGMVRFWVRDNGPGLSEEERIRLFTPFTRFSQIRATGYGLGLSIVRRIIEKLGGEVAVESDGVEGQGSIFSFTLPAPKKKSNGRRN